MDQRNLLAAIKELRKVVKLHPTAPRARDDLAVALMRNGRLDSATVQFREALRLARVSDWRWAIKATHVWQVKTSRTRSRS